MPDPNALTVDAALIGAGGMLTKVAGDIIMKIVGQELDVYGSWRARQAARRVERWEAAAAEAAKMIEASGKPVQAVPDHILMPIFDGMSLHDDEDLQRSWASLLANATTTGVRVVYATILMDLEPQDARLLNVLCDNDKRSRQQQHLATRQFTYDAVQLTYHPNHYFTIDKNTPSDDRESFFVLLKHTLIERGPEIGTGQSYFVTELGWNFMRACTPPTHQN